MSASDLDPRELEERERLAALDPERLRSRVARLLKRAAERAEAAAIGHREFRRELLATDPASIRGDFRADLEALASRLTVEEERAVALDPDECRRIRASLEAEGERLENAKRSRPRRRTAE
jgi:hypothetical protein